MLWMKYVGGFGRQVLAQPWSVSLSSFARNGTTFLKLHHVRYLSSAGRGSVIFFWQSLPPPSWGRSGAKNEAKSLKP